LLNLFDECQAPVELDSPLPYNEKVAGVYLRIEKRTWFALSPTSKRSPNLDVANGSLYLQPPKIPQTFGASLFDFH